MSPLPALNRTLVAGDVTLGLAAPAFAHGGGGGGGAHGGGVGPAGRGPGFESAAGRSAGHLDNGAKSGGGHHGGGGHHHHPIPIWWLGGGGFGFGGFAYASPFYDPFYDGWYGRRLYGDENGSSSGDNVTLRVKPENASVYVNGVLYSGRGHGHFNLPAGEWTVELRAPGYLPQTVNLRVEQGVRYTVERKLEKDRSQEPAGKRRKIEDLSDTEFAR